MNPSKIYSIENSLANKIQIYSLSSRTEINFSSFLTSFNDSVNENWSSQDIFGRMDPIYSYKNTTRKISLGFDVPSHDIEEAKDNYKNINLLMDSMYPIYNKDTTIGTAIIKSPPLFKINLSNLINENKDTNGLLGWIDNIVFKPELASGFFVDKEESELFPKLFKVSFNFNVMHRENIGTKPNIQTGGETSDASAETSPAAPVEESSKAKTDVVGTSEKKYDPYVQTHYRYDQKNKNISPNELDQINSNYIKLCQIKIIYGQNSHEFKTALQRFKELLESSRNSPIPGKSK